MAALKDERLSMAALDVFATEPTPAERWADVPNVALSPHTGGATSAALPKMVALTPREPAPLLRRRAAGERGGGIEAAPARRTPARVSVARRL
ncbi:MAG: NAD(P)-dependent oxidoreductase [Caulobacteraceae bacterium]